MKDKIKVLHVPEICEYNEFIERTIEIQKKNNIEVLRPNICIDGTENGSNNLEDILEYIENENEKVVIHFHWAEKLYKQLTFLEFKRAIENLKNKNVRIVKTIHNLRPHEMEEEHENKENFLNNSLDGIIFFSKSQMNSYNEIKGQHIKRTVIPHPNYKIENIKKDISQNNQYTLCVPGRIRKYKQTYIILEVLKKLKKYNIKIIVAGKPDDEESVKALRENSSPDLICDFRFLGSEELKKCIETSDMVLLTHKKIWTSGIAILAANIGTTLIGTLPKTFEEYNSEQVGYFLKNNEEMTADKMIKLIEKAILDGKKEIYNRGQVLKEIIGRNTDELIGKLYKNFYEGLFK